MDRRLGDLDPAHFETPQRVALADLLVTARPVQRSRLLQRLLRDQFSHVRLHAVRAAMAVDDPALVPFLVDRLQDHSIDVALVAVEALGRQTAPRARQAIEATRSDGDPRLRLAAEAALEGAR
ncbi:MAG: HEAT repeat protein [Myxococcota bacterium]